jgi:DNA-directed RNA polymerase subunit RPC12/RpoP
MISIDDYKKDGKLDWAAYQKAQVDNGEACRECKKYIYPPKGTPSLCYACISLHQDKFEVSHNERIRCPKCGHLWPASDEEGELHSEGTHEVTCPECEAEFEINTSVSYEFTSPALEDTKKEEVVTP